MLISLFRKINVKIEFLLFVLKLKYFFLDSHESNFTRLEKITGNRDTYIFVEIHL